MHTIHTHDNSDTDITMSLRDDHVHLQVVNNAYTPTGNLSVDALRELAKAATELADTLEQRQQHPVAEPSPNVWKDSSGLWHAKVPAADAYNTERDLAKALISKARDEDYLSVYGRARTGDAAYNPSVSLEQAGPGETNVWTEYP